MEISLRFRSAGGLRVVTAATAATANIPVAIHTVACRQAARRRAPSTVDAVAPTAPTAPTATAATAATAATTTAATTTAATSTAATAVATTAANATVVGGRHGLDHSDSM
jgi:hypothetical protein